MGQVKLLLASFVPKWSVVFASRNISRRLRRVSRGTGGWWSLTARKFWLRYLSVIHKAMSCRSYWILCMSCLAFWLLMMADRDPCYVCMFWLANVKCSVVCLSECCLYCYYCTVPLFTVRCSPVADWCLVSESCEIVFVTCVTIGPARSSCLLSMLLSFVLYC